ncbi:MAG TPA: gamma carbonic anhydrase family protein [Polyangiaceae bacterium]|nr:gamma carbonic anhydrase family protein [Polyangiaceae bacterium]
MSIVREVLGKAPRIAASAFVAQGAVVVGDVELADEVSIWYGAVLRGDVGFIRIGTRTNVQDQSCIHMTTGTSNSVIGSEVTIGHGVIVHGATIGDGALVGMGSVLLDNCEIGAESLVAAGSVVPPRMQVPPRSLVRGQPAKVIRPLREDEWIQGRIGARVYVELMAAHRA